MRCARAHCNAISSGSPPLPFRRESLKGRLSQLEGSSQAGAPENWIGPLTPYRYSGRLPYVQIFWLGHVIAAFAVLLLRPRTVEMLRGFFKGRASSSGAFPNMPKDYRTAEMIRADLKAAGIPYKDEAGWRFDFHALRHQLARHSTIALTMDLYTHSLREDERKALEKLPSL